MERGKGIFVYGHMARKEEIEGMVTGWGGGGNSVEKPLKKCDHGLGVPRYRIRK
jgi:hypothetical protein